jgi:chorismate mutase
MDETTEREMEERLADYRKRIDDLDDVIAERLNERAQIVLTIRELKNVAKLPLFDSQREQEILTRLSISNKGPLSGEDLKEIYRHVLFHMKNFE